MMLVPYNTDAPIYHWPVATVAIIVINTIIYFLTCFQVLLGNMEIESIEWLMLEFDTINPVQWITSAFMHADPFHLIGNMIFLWAFGLVVEGKIGSLRFVALYAIIALIDGAMVQLPMFVIGSDSGALGASGVIFALLTMAVIWAPENEMDCFFWFLFFFGTVEIRLVSLGAFYIFLQIFFLFIGGFQMSSEMLHMVGVVIGAPIAFFMLRQDMVDCEGWDLVSRNEFLQDNDLFCSPKQRKRLRQKEREVHDPVTAVLGHSTPGARPQPTQTQGAIPVAYAPIGTNANPEADTPKQKKRTAFNRLQDFFEPERVKEQRRREEQAEAQTPDVSSHPEFNRMSFAFRQSLESQNLAAAMQQFQRMDHIQIAIGLGDKSLMRYVTMLSAQKKWVESLRPLSIIVAHQGQAADDARLRIAHIQLKELRNPNMALQTLSQVADVSESTDPSHQKRMELKARLTQAAQRALVR